MNKELTLTEYIPVFLQVLHDCGHELDFAWLPEEFLHLDDQRTFITVDACNTFWKNCFKATGDRRISFEYGKALTIDTHGFFGYAVKTSANLRETIEICRKFAASRISNIALDLDEFDRCFVCNLYFNVPGGMLPPYMEALMALVQRTVADTGLPVEALNRVRVNLSYPRPDYAELYEQYLLFDYHFSQPINAFVADRHLLDVPSPLHEPALKKLAVEQLEKVYQQEGDATLLRVKDYIRKHVASGANLTEAADRLSSSPRTIKRKLARLGVSFSEILQEVRFNLAIDLLQSTNLPIEEVALRVGYSHASSFINAFKKRMDTTPADWRSHFH
ncbi:MAG: helix-turn-helix domain-containing protein [Pseudomonadota bacterium]